ncbi:MAG: hypothetical protein WCT01_02810 [Candidatus Shapirobacteria bacterium]
MDQLERAINEAVLSAKKHGQNLNSQLVTLRLVTNQPWSEKQVKDKWRQMCPRGDADYIENNFSQDKIEKAENMAQKLVKIKWIKMVAVTGSVAMLSSKGEDDIDILIITQSNRLWLARAIGMIWLKVAGIEFRRAGEKLVADKFCFNMWLEEQSLEISAQKRSVGAAVDVVNMKVVAGNKNIYGELLRKNRWVEAVAAPGYRYRLQGANKITLCKSKCDFWAVFNLVAYWVQRIYMRPKMTKEIVNLKAAYFHPRLI